MFTSILVVAVIILSILLISPKIQRTLYLRKNPRVRAHLVGIELYNALYKQEEERSEIENDQFSIEKVHLSFANFFFIKEDIALAIYEELKEVKGDYLWYLITAAPPKEFQNLDYIKQLILKVKVEINDFLPQLIVAKYIEYCYGIEEAGKYAFDLATDKLI